MGGAHGQRHVPGTVQNEEVGNPKHVVQEAAEKSSKPDIRQNALDRKVKGGRAERGGHGDQAENKIRYENGPGFWSDVKVKLDTNIRPKASTISYLNYLSA